MKKIILFVLSMSVISTGFAERFVLNNRVSNPGNNQKAKIAIQWAISAKDIEESNNMVREGGTLYSDALRVLTQRGKIRLDIPKAGYFRVLVWSTDAGSPDFLTNWVHIVPNKTYTLNDDHLIPLALMSGSGC